MTINKQVAGWNCFRDNPDRCRKQKLGSLGLQNCSILLSTRSWFVIVHSVNWIGFALHYPGSVPGCIL